MAAFRHLIGRGGHGKEQRCNEEQTRVSRTLPSESVMLYAVGKLAASRAGLISGGFDGEKIQTRVDRLGWVFLAQQVQMAGDLSPLLLKERMFKNTFKT